jgi:sensor c-di-GMP phosphodiesterase-like protein
VRQPTKKRLSSALRLAAILSACALAGLAVGLSVAFKATTRKLDRYATSILQYADAYSDEIVSTLDQVNASPFPFCSDQDIARLRSLAFQGHLVKEIGRVRDKALYCTSVNGRLDHPIPEGTPDIVLASGRTISLHRLLETVPGMYGDITHYRGASFISAQNAFGDLTEAPMTYTTALTNRSTGKVLRTAGVPLALSSEEVFAEKELLKGAVLFLPKCSTRYAPCVVTGITVHDALRLNRPLIFGFVLLGVLSGVALGFTLIIQRRKRTLATQLRSAIHRELLTVAYQPIVDVKTGTILGAEALARWSDEDGQPIRPDVFVTTAEEQGFITKLTSLVLKLIVAEMGDFLRTHPDFHINVNIAAADLADPQFLPMLEKLLLKNSIAQRSINLELTERSTADHHLAITAIGKLRQRGHEFHIDDFGTGFSSLSYLNQLAIDAIKIDRAFTEAIGTGSLTAAIVPQILAMAQSLKIKVIVEGVERAEQATFFAGLDQQILAQGWFYSSAIPAAELIRLILAGSNE